MVPDYYVRKQTLTNAERYITPELKELEDTILGAEDRLTSLEYELFRDVRKQISDNVSRIQKTARAIAQIDVFASLADHYIVLILTFINQPEQFNQFHNKSSLSPVSTGITNK